MKKLALVLAGMLCMNGIANAIGISIEVGDQPYYIHGARYWSGNAYWCWIPGHWNKRHTVWIHGHYRPC